MQEQATNTAAEETALSQTPIAFLSYVNLDDQHEQGRYNGGAGISVHYSGGDIFEANDLRGNTKGAWDIEPDSKALVQRTGNLE